MRSINAEDFEAGLNEQGISYKNSTGGYTGIAVGTTKTIYNGLYYPEIFNQENGYGIDTTTIKNNGIDSSDSYYSSPTMNGYRTANYSLTATQTGFLTLNLNNKKYYNDENFYNLIWSNANSNPYFLATRQVNISTNTSGIDYELNYVGIALEPGLAFSNGSNSETRLGIRPIVPIGQDVIIYGGDGTEAHPYQLKL